MNDLDEINNETREYENDSNRDNNEYSWPRHYYSSPSLQYAMPTQWWSEKEKEKKVRENMKNKICDLCLKEIPISTQLHGLWSGMGGRLSSLLPAFLYFSSQIITFSQYKASSLSLPLPLSPPLYINNFSSKSFIKN